MAARTPGRWGTALAVAVALSALSVAPAHAIRPSPRQAAAELVARMHPARVRAHLCTFARSKVVSRHRRLWLAVGSTCYPDDELRTRIQIFRWSGGAWRRDGSVTGPLGPSQWLNAASLTGSLAPDFAVQGCGAADTNCLSVVSRLGGRWHAIPFEYGYGTSLEVNGTPAGRRVLTAVDACSCAGGPSTWTYERYAHGRFVPAQPPGRAPHCGPAALAGVADPWYLKVLRFTQVRCAAGWALAVGDGAGFGGTVVGLFTRGFNGHRWQVLTLDAGNALPAAPAFYDLPLSLLTRLAGTAVVPELAAAKLIAGLQTQYGFAWPGQNGIVDAGGSRWLIAVVPAGPEPKDGSTPPAGAVIHRWNGTAWVVDGRIARLPDRLNAGYYGGWFVPAPAPEPSAVAFDLAGDACCQPKGQSVITNSGGAWHVA